MHRSKTSRQQSFNRMASNKPTGVEKTGATTNPPGAAATRAAQPELPPLFRPVDWLTFAVTALTVFLAYLYTLAPDLTLEDCGELATASYYAGIPHPPGYPVWTLYTWLWTHLPWSNIAWRVALASAFAGALACGFLGLLVSRGSSMLMEGLEELKAMTGRWESAICMVSGFVAGGLLGFNGFMWSQSIIVEVYSLSVLSLVLVLLFLLRWIYAPDQWRYLYWAFFMFGICFTNHQSLLVAAMGIEVAIIAARPALGRDFMLANSIVYLLGLVAYAMGKLPTFESQPGQLNMMFVIFNMVGVGSLVTLWWLYHKTQRLGTFWRPVLVCGLLFFLGVSFYLYMPIAGMTNPPMQWGYPRTEEGFWHALTRGQYEKANPTNFITDPQRFLMQLGMLIEGVADEFSWVFMFIALVPFLFLRRMQQRERAWIVGVTAIYLCLGVLLMILLNPPPDRAARELIRVFFTASHVCVALLVGYGLTLVAAYMATHFASFRIHGLWGGGVALALAIMGLSFRIEELFGGEPDVGPLTLFFTGIARAFQPHQYGLTIYAGLMLVGMTLAFIAGCAIYRRRAPLAITLAMFALMPAYSFMNNWFENEQRGHLFGYWFGHDMFCPPFVGPDGKLTYDRNLREQYLKDPEKSRFVYPEMARHAVLYGGTDPGRFCPTYTIFCESFIPPRCKPRDPEFDRRDVYIITQNALADGTYLMYIRAHYNKSEQVKYDTPFFQELLRSEEESRANYRTNLLARLACLLLDRPLTALGNAVEKRRRAGSSYFNPEDFLPGFVEKLRAQADPVSAFLYTNLTERTRQSLVGPTPDLKALARDLNAILEREYNAWQQLAKLRAQKAALEDKLLGLTPTPRQKRQLDSLRDQIAALENLEPLYTPQRFAHVQLSDHVQKFIRQNPRLHTRIRLNRLLLEEAYPGLLARSKGGVYPDLEIYIASPDDSQRCFNQYIEDAARRLRLNQLKPGENVSLVGTGPDQKVQVSGQVSVMAINGLIAKVMFDKNPDHEFYVEESFPLDWMYPHLVPFGIIMKVNREPLPELTEDILARDHHFWSHYSERLIGNWITYDTPVRQITEWAERVYLRRNFADFKGDPKFARDDQAQKSFSKLRSSIAGVYAWRVAEANNRLAQLQANPLPDPAAQKAQIAHWTAVRDRMIREADFAFRQAFAFCPYSPEAVFRYCQLLISLQRYNDAYLIAETCRKLDPYNQQVSDLAQRLRTVRDVGPTALLPGIPDLATMERTLATNPADFQNALDLAATYLSLGQTNRAFEVFDGIVHHPQAPAGALLAVAQAYVSLGNYPRLETTLERLVQINPTQPEAWYDLAAMKAILQKPAEAIPALRRALELSDARLQTNANASNLRQIARQDPRFKHLAQNPAFQKLLEPSPP
jgi:tetratricopeptide (TPR) repeat protein